MRCQDDPRTPACAGPAGLSVTRVPPGDVLRRHGIRPRRSLGQHFLLDPSLARRIVRAGGPVAGERILEAGAGTGSLTRALLAEQAGHVIAVERDSACLPPLAELAGSFPGRVSVVHGDALALDEALWQEDGRPLRIVSNLPYNISVPLIVKWLGRRELFSGLLLLCQREVACRLLAGPGERHYGRLSVLSRWLCTGRSCLDIPPGAFTPPPRVMSRLVSLTPRPQPLAPADPVLLRRLTAAAFGQRRKMLKSSLRTIGADLPGAAGLSPALRAGDVTVEAYCRMAQILAGPGNPPAPLDKHDGEC